MDQIIRAPSDTEADLLRWNLIHKRAQEWKVRRAFDILRDNGIEPILIKGWAAGIYYPESHPRISIDIDLAVSASDFDRAATISMDSAREGLAMDIHRELRHLDTVEWGDLARNSVFVEAEGYPIRMLRAEDHLRVLCVHWLTDGALNKDRLWDAYYLVDNRSEDFDWNRFLGVVGPIRRRWLVCTLGLAARYLGLDLSNTPISKEAQELPNWLVRTVEKNWSANAKHVPVEVALFTPAVLIDQLDRLFRPNPIASTIAMEGSFDARTRLHYQVASFATRLLPAFRRVRTTVRQKIK